MAQDMFLNFFIEFFIHFASIRVDLLSKQRQNRFIFVTRKFSQFCVIVRNEYP